MQQPVIWSFFGYPFEAAGMVAGLFGCFAARFWIGAGQQMRKEHRWSLDVPVSAMALAFTAALIILQRPAPFGGLLYGAGAGVLGEGIFKLAERYMSKAMAVLGDDKPSDGSSPQAMVSMPRKPDPDTAHGIKRALQSLDVPTDP